MAGASVLALTSVASGQEAVEEVLVTGSRVITNGDNSPTPVTVLPMADIVQVQPTTLADGLNLLPVFSGSRGQFSNPSATGGVGAGNGVANQLNLRNIGANRNLILFDGHRLPPTLISGIVDMDMVPQMLIQQVDTVTGGVSAVYGSDAITGVVNFITDRDFNGVKTHAQYGMAEEGDGEAFNGGIAFGTELFGGRGHLEGSYEYREDKGVLYRSDRDWYNQAAIEGAGTAANPYRLYQNVRIATAPFGGLVTNGVLAGRNFAADGVLTPFVHGASTNTACCEVGGDGGYFDSSLKSPLESHQLFGRFDFDFTDDLHGYAVASANLKTNQIYADYVQLTNVTLGSQNGFLAAPYRTELQNAGQSTFRLSKLIDNAPRLNPEAESDQYYFNTGLEGKLGDYRWGVSFTHGMTELTTTLHNNINNERLAAALDAVVDPSTGQVVCNVTLTNPNLQPGCVPLNVFGPTAASAGAIDYILGDTQLDAETAMDDVVADIAGAPFSTWAGPVNMALSAEWRRLTYKASSDGEPTDFANCTGLRYNCTSGTTREWVQTFAGSPKVSQTVWETAIEFDAPLLKDKPLVQSFNLNGAARFTSFDTSGDYTTWKVGLDWHMNDAFRFRATRSRDIRAPTLNDLYAPESVVMVNNTDLLTGQSPSVPSINYGNTELTAELGTTTTAGIVWQPDWISQFSFALDGYHIVVDDAVTTVQGFNPTFQRACYASGGTSPYCALQVRPGGFGDTSAANAATAWLVTVINISEIETYGADLEMNWSSEAFGRRFQVRGLATYQPHIYYRTPALATVDMGGVAFGTNGLTASPEWRLTGFVRAEVTDNLSVDLMQRWRSSMKLSGDPTQVWVNNHVASVGYTNLNVNYRFEHKTLGDVNMFFNVQNLFDKEPPAAAFFGANTIPGLFGGWPIGDDPMGRYFTLGVRISL